MHPSTPHQHSWCLIEGCLYSGRALIKPSLVHMMVTERACSRQAPRTSAFSWCVVDSSAMQPVEAMNASPWVRRKEETKAIIKKKSTQ